MRLLVESKFAAFATKIGLEGVFGGRVSSSAQKGCPYLHDMNTCHPSPFSNCTFPRKRHLWSANN